MDLVTRSTEIAQKLLAERLPRRWAHVLGVMKRAKFASAAFGQDREVLLAAAVLHDVGYAPDLAKTGFHALDGAVYLRDLGVPQRICALVAHHSCAHMEAELRGLGAELSEWQDEGSPLRDVLWWADMTTAPTGEPMHPLDRIEEIQKRYGSEDLVTFFIRQAKPELLAAVGRAEDWLREAGVDYTAK